jgi:hypothetical protein
MPWKRSYIAVWIAHRQPPPCIYHREFLPVISRAAAAKRNTNTRVPPATVCAARCSKLQTHPNLQPSRATHKPQAPAWMLQILVDGLRCTLRLPPLLPK